MTWTTRPRSEAGGIAFVQEGEGPRLLLLHGVGLRAEAWNGQIAGLAKDFEVTAPDLPGHGVSARLEGLPGLPDFSNSLARFLDRPVVVIGHSMGAMIALDLAIRFPDHVVGVAALNAIYRRTEAAKEAVQKRADNLDGGTAPDPEPTLQRWFGNEPTPERQACASWLTSTDPLGYRTAYRTFAAEDGPSGEELAGLTCPALFLTGGLEPNSTPAMSRAMAGLAPQGRAAVIEDAAHMMPMTHADAVTAILKEFARECLK
ncbi:alpha/beta fold hydrolase [Roseibium sediminicola]|uniref:Alpha/beta hydrolase n=1 Tax=Roseibium sediminicola TaxID=2933272 RepID=A0ABT0GUP0_9HYPH|nr:alpha/beta hydrolase [Roseibium sp. CAU 1639]MCK7613143.1 alpha/beta hydrolase [Roseibium sp. CAU 1639]